MNSPTFENKIRILKICIQGKKVEVTCPNGDIEKFCMSSTEDSFEGFPLFTKDPLALMAIADSVYGYILKKYVRLSKPKEAAATAAAAACRVLKPDGFAPPAASVISRATATTSPGSEAALFSA